MPANNPMAYLDPSLLQQQAQGLSAINELKMLPQSAQYAQALRQSEATLPEATGQGFARTGPNFMNLLGMMAERAGGRKKLGALDTRAQALRGQAQQGTMAELQAQEQQRQMEAQQRAQELEAQRAFQRERDQAAAGQIKGPFRSWVNEETGEMITASNTAEGAIDSQGQPVNLDGFRPYEPPRAAAGGGRAYAHTQKKAIPAVATLKNINQVRGMADELDENDVGELNDLTEQIFAQTLAPKAIEEYIESNWMNYSPRVKRYLSAMRAITAQARHALTGAALTRFEERITNAFLPTPTTKGLTVEDRMSRLGNLYDRARTELEAIDEVTGTEFSNKYDQWEEWKPNFSKEAGLDVGGGDGTLTPRLQDLYDQYYRRTNRRHPDDPRKSEKVEQKGARDMGDLIGGMEFDDGL